MVDNINGLIEELKDGTIYYNGKINDNNDDLKKLFQDAIQNVNNDNDKVINKCIVDIIASDLYELYSKNQLKKKIDGHLRQYEWNYIVNDIYKTNKIGIDELIKTTTPTTNDAEKVKQKLFNKLYNFLKNGSDFLKNRSDFLKNRSLGKNEEGMKKRKMIFKKDNKIGNLALDIRKYIKNDLENINHSLKSTLTKILESRIEHGIDVDEIRNEQKRNLYKSKFGTFKRDVLYNNPYLGNLFSAYIKNLKNVPSDNRILYKNKLLYNEQYIRNTFDQYHKKLRVNRKKKYQESKEEKLKEKLLKVRIERAVRNYIRKKKIENIKNHSKKEKQDKLNEEQEQDTSNEDEAKQIIIELMNNDVDKITIQDAKITDLNRVINNLNSGPKSYISKLSHGVLRDQILDSNGGGITKPHSTVQTGGADTDKVEKLEKIITILKQLNSNNYVDYNLDSIIKGLQDLLGGVDDVDTSIPELIKSTTIMKHHLYPEPLPICDEDGTPCKENKDKLKKRLEYFEKLKELQTMHKDKKILTLNDENVIKNINTLESYFKPVANPNESVDVNNKEQLKTQEENQKKKYTELGTFTPIGDVKAKGNKTYESYNDIVKHLNEKKDDFINPHINSKYMTTNTTVSTNKSFFHNLLNMEQFFDLFNNYKGSDFHIAAYSTPNNKPDPRHVYEEKRDNINSTNKLQSEIPVTQ